MLERVLKLTLNKYYQRWCQWLDLKAKLWKSKSCMNGSHSAALSFKLFGHKDSTCKRRDEASGNDKKEMDQMPKPNDNEQHKVLNDEMGREEVNTSDEPVRAVPQPTEPIHRIQEVEKVISTPVASSSGGDGSSSIKSTMNAHDEGADEETTEQSTESVDQGEFHIVGRGRRKQKTVKVSMDQVKKKWTSTTGGRKSTKGVT